MGSRVSPSWQQRLAMGEAYWPTAGPGEGGHKETKTRHTSSPSLTSTYTRTHSERLGTQERPKERASGPPTFNPRTWISGPDTISWLSQEQRSQKADPHPDPWAQGESFTGTHNSRFSLIAFWKFTFLFFRAFLSLGHLRPGREQDCSQVWGAGPPTSPPCSSLPAQPFPPLLFLSYPLRPLLLLHLPTTRSPSSSVLTLSDWGQLVSIRKGQTSCLERLKGTVPTPRTTAKVIAVHSFEDLARKGRDVAETRVAVGTIGHSAAGERAGYRQVRETQRVGRQRPRGPRLQGGLGGVHE